MRVAAYCRVSTHDEAQAGSFALQVQHYREMIEQNPKWTLADVYADEGASATSMQKRTNFLRMLEDCRAGHIDLIMTKNVSRFARNTLDCINTVRMLKALSPPIGVFFEVENLNTLESKNEFTLGVMSLVAQGESEQKSAAITWSIIERFKKGIPIVSTHNLLGYDKDAMGQVVVVEPEAQIVRYIYNSYIGGAGACEIAKALTAACIPTVMGNMVWRSAAILRILRNEKYCGDVLMQKTYTVDCFTHKKKKNTGQKPMYRLKDGIPAIVEKEQWHAVQALLKEGRRAGKGAQVQAKVPYACPVKLDALHGFVYISLHWRANDVLKILNHDTEERNETDGRKNESG